MTVGYAGDHGSNATPEEAVDGSTEDDHLSALFFTPNDLGSHGKYTVGRFELRHHGGDDIRDRLVHHHEAQHVVLTMETAWGVALLVTSRISGWSQLFTTLLEHCRLTHESFATYLSCSTLAVANLSTAPALTTYPDYVPLFERLEQYAASIPGDHRRSLAIVALARVCMQTPILRRLVESWPEPPTLASTRAMDRPDERWNVLLRESGLPAEIAEKADAAVIAKFGADVLATDRPDSGNAALDDELDVVWACWEDRFFDGLADHLAGKGADVVAGDGHLPDAATVVELARRDVPDFDLKINHDPVVPDRLVLDGVLRQMRLWLAESHLPARLITLGHEVDLEEVVRVADVTTRINGRPNLVLSARRPTRLLSGHDFPQQEQTALVTMREPLVFVRTLADDGTDTETDAVWHVRLPTPAAVAALARVWGKERDLTCCVAVSCLADQEWRTEWLPALAAVGPVVWLLDVPIDTVAGEFGPNRTVQGLYLDLTDTPTGARRALALRVTGTAGVWLAVADHVGIELITQQVADLPGIDLRMTGADWSGTLPAVRLALLDLLHTESYLDLQGLTRDRS